MAEVTKYTLTLGTVTNKGKKCKNPNVEILSTGDFSIACIDDGKGVYQLEGLLPENKCIDFLISCGECSECSPKEIRKCVCDDENECGSCETCGEDGFCVSRCTDDTYCFEERCVECDPETPCPDGKVCKSGRCVCPQNKPYLVNGKCLECIEDAPCKECVNGVFVNKDCIGVCDPAQDKCVECLQSGDCDGDNECCVGKSCNCCEGYVRDVNGICVPKPECDENTHCGPCQTCQQGNCEQVVCPPGKICLGTAGCVEECECNTPAPCSDPTSRCVTTTQGCGCIPCTGDCETGCSDGCYCLGDQCVGDICAGNKCPCQNGTDCPEGYGCDGLNCVPCASLDCNNSECTNVLGCQCSNRGCIDSDINCGNSPCTTSDDCAFGCACDEGLCKSCDNYPCAECGGVQGCGCTGLNCEGQETECNDSFTLVKDSGDCTLTATLNKGEDCACPPITVDVVTRRRPIGDSSNYKLEFKGEVRKGVYGGVLDMPLLDNLVSPDIVENDSPTSGKITVTSVAKYREYIVDPITGVRLTPTIVTETPRVLEGSFISGTTASITLGELEYQPLDTVIVTERDEQGRITKEIKYFRIDISAKITDDFDFPNQCTYQDGATIGTYRLLKNEDFLAFGFAFGNHIAKTVTSSESRLPIFRWYKSATDVITGDPFRKVYVPKTGVNYVDTIGYDEGVEGCKHYKVISDCTCATSPNLKAVFCNPMDIEFTVTGCNRQINISPEIVQPCDVNGNIQFYIRAGSVYQTWLGSRWDIIAGASFTSSTAITSVEFGQVCDTTNICKKTYGVESTLDDLRLSITPTCNPSGTQGSFVVPNTDVDTRCSVVSITVAGVVYVPGSTVTVPSGVTSYTVTWACGCPPTTGTVNVVCCENLSQNIVRNCSGSIICNSIAGVVYKVDGVVIPNICTYVAGLARDVAVTIVAQRPGCDPLNIPIPAIQDQCCDNFDFTILNNGGGNIGITIFGEITAPIVITKTGGGVLTNGEAIIGTGQNRTFINVDRSVDYTLTLNSAFGCSSISKLIKGTLIGPGPGTGGEPIVDDTPPPTSGGTTNALGVIANTTFNSSQPIADTCGSQTQLYRHKTGSNYTLRAEVEAQNCPCGEAVGTLEITNVNDNVLQEALDVSYVTTIDTVVSLVGSGNSVVVRDVNRGTNYPVNINGSGLLQIPKSITSDVESNVVTVFYRLRRDATSTPNTRLTGFTLIPRDESLSVTDFDLTKVASASLLLQTNTGASGTFAATILSDRIEFMPNNDIVRFLIGEPPGVTLTATMTFAMTSGDVQTIVKNIPLEPAGTFGYNLSYSFFETLNNYIETESNVVLQMIVNNAALLNDCRYTGGTPSLAINSGGVVSSSVVSTPLSGDSTPAFTEFVWRENGTIVFTDYSNGISELPVVEATIGATYLLSTSCGICQESQTINLCPPITGTVTLTNCLDSVTFTMAADTGNVYNVTFEGVTQSGLAAVAGVVTATFAGALAENTNYDVDFALNGVAGCVATFNFATTTQTGTC